VVIVTGLIGSQSVSNCAADWNRYGRAARGADSIAATEAIFMGFKVRSYPADWNRYGKAAGPIRNKLMLDQNPDLVLAFHPNIAQSKGTGNMVSIAKAKGTPVEVFSE
jgi:hypothetical protein